MYRVSSLKLCFFFFFLSNLVSLYLYIVLLLVCFHSLTSFIFHFSLIYYERPSSIFNRNKSGPSSSNSTTTRVLLYKLTSIIIPLVHPVLVRFAFSSHSPRFVWIRLRDFPFPGLLHTHDFTSVQSFATVNDIRMPALAMYLVALPRSLHFFAFILHLTAIFFHVISESHYLLKLSRLDQKLFLKEPLTYFVTKKREKNIYACISLISFSGKSIFLFFPCDTYTNLSLLRFSFVVCCFWLYSVFFEDYNKFLSPNFFLSTSNFILSLMLGI